MSKFLKFFLVLVVLLTAAVLVFLQVVKPRLSDYIKSALNNSIEAKIDYRAADISFFRAFPRVSVTLRDLQVTEKSDQRSPDTLATVERFSVAFDALSVFSGEFNVHSLRIERPRIVVRKDSAGKSNWDIFTEAGSPETAPDSAGFSLSLRDFKIREGFVAFYDSSNGNSFRIDGLNHQMQGRLSGGSSTLVTNNVIESLSVDLGGVAWLQKAKASFNAEIAADLERRKFTLKDNRLGLNDLGIVFNGTISLLDDAVNTDLDFKADKAALKELLSLLPAVYENNYEKLDAEGSVALSGHVKGLYTGEKLPAFRLALDVSNGSFGYEGVPVRAEDIVFKGGVDNPGGDADKTSLSVPKLDLKINGRPFIMSFGVRTPVSDPYIDAAVNGSINLADFQRIYPVKDLQVAGELRSNIVVKGNLSAFNAGLTGLGRTEAYGSVVAKGVSIVSEKFTPALSIASAQLNLSPAYLNLVDLRMKTGKSDFTANGRVENYISYFMKKGILKVTADVRSDFVQLDEFRNLEEEQAPLMLPGNVSMRIDGTFNRVRFGEMQFEGARGVIVMEDEKLDFRDINAETLGGKVAINGFYSTKGGQTDTDFSITADEMNIASSYESLKLLEQVAPVAGYAKGDVSANLNMRSRLDENFKPVPESISGKGRVETKGLLVEEFPPIRKLALLLDVEALDTLRVPEAAVDFVIENGRVTTAPFSFTVNDIRLSASGVTGFDKSLDWKIGLEIPKKYIGTTGVETITGLLEKLPLKNMDLSLPDTVVVDAALRGSITKPEIGLDLGKTADRIALRLKENLQKKVTDELRDRLLPGSKGDSSATDSGGVSDILKKAAGDILFRKEQQVPGDAVDTTGKEKGALPLLIENILSPAKKQSVEQPESADTTGTVANTEEGGEAVQAADSSKQSSRADSIPEKKSIIDLLR